MASEGSRARALSEAGSSASHLRPPTTPTGAASVSASGVPTKSTAVPRPRGPARPPSLSNIRTALTNAPVAVGKRARSSSIVSVQEIMPDYEETLDSEALINLNADWVNYKGAWLIHVVLLAAGKVVIDILPGISQDMSWTIVLQGYMVISYLMFHYVTGTPFDAHSGVYDQLTMWEQIDGGAQYTPAKKWLTSLPIVLFLLSTHYTRYDQHPTLFTLNFLSLLFVGLAPKLPQMHRLRIRFFEPIVPPKRQNSQSSSRAPTPLGRTGHGPPTPITEEEGTALAPTAAAA